MFKNQKGITLIALVITIIVLLILAGVTIAMLTGTDSAPVKANEAKQKQDIGAAKDQVMLYAEEFRTMAYEKIYVKGEGVNAASGQSRGASVKSTDIGTLVGSGIQTQESTTSFTSIFGTGINTSLTKGLGGKKVGLATITTSNAAITGITPASTDSTAAANVSAYVRIDTTDFVTYGHIEKAGGALVWDKDIQTRTN